MNIEIKKSIKPINYFDAINFLEKRLEDLHKNIDKELIWTLEHNEIFTAGTNYKESEILDNSIELIKTNRGGKITCHAPGQLVCYFVLDLRKKKDIRKFISCIEKTIIETLKEFVIKRASLLAILDVTTFIYSLLNSKLTFLSFIFFTKDINLPIN